MKTRRQFFAALVTAPLIKAGLLKAPTGGLFNPTANIAAQYKTGDTVPLKMPARFLTDEAQADLEFYEGEQWEYMETIQFSPPNRHQPAYSHLAFTSQSNAAGRQPQRRPAIAAGS